MRNVKVFRSRISVLFVFFMIIVFIPAFIRIFQNSMYQYLYFIIGILIFTVLLSTGIRYVISGDNLSIKVWFIPCASMNINKIVSIERSYNLLSSPAVSLKRLRITFLNGHSWLISPIREKEFIEELNSINSININISSSKGLWKIIDWDI